MLTQRYAEANPSLCACQTKLKKSLPMQPNDAFRRTTSKPCINIHTHAKGSEGFGVPQLERKPQITAVLCVHRHTHALCQILPFCLSLNQMNQRNYSLKHYIKCWYFFNLLILVGKSAKSPKKIPQIPKLTPVKDWGRGAEWETDGEWEGGCSSQKVTTNCCISVGL